MSRASLSPALHFFFTHFCLGEDPCGRDLCFNWQHGLGPLRGRMGLPPVDVWLEVLSRVSFVTSSLRDASLSGMGLGPIRASFLMMAQFVSSRRVAPVERSREKLD
jgi:hypothetical protein